MAGAGGDVKEVSHARLDHLIAVDELHPALGDEERLVLVVMDVRGVVGVRRDGSLLGLSFPPVWAPVTFTASFSSPTYRIRPSSPRTMKPLAAVQSGSSLSGRAKPS
ncbi:hypothetical protein GCM10010478_63690 [Streptomyces erythrogriseus]|uniref:Uncharacterized protein n=1 Tax=Streptomyces erythrogriseus TaxID=284027 RepID=A0ABN3XHP4_9ACTN